MSAASNKHETDSITRNTYIKINFATIATTIIFIIGVTISATLWCASVKSDLDSLKKEISNLHNTIDQIQKKLESKGPTVSKNP